LCITKIDVLNHFDELKAATHYRYEGADHTELPFDINEVKVEPVYKSFKGWNQDLMETPQYEELPEALRHFTMFLEKQLDVPITMISTGPEREKLVLREEAVGLVG
jgi:adenylosuccinate synthase